MHSKKFFSDIAPVALQLEDRGQVVNMVLDGALQENRHLYDLKSNFRRDWHVALESTLISPKKNFCQVCFTKTDFQFKIENVSTKLTEWKIIIGIVRQGFALEPGEWIGKQNNGWGYIANGKKKTSVNDCAQGIKSLLNTTQLDIDRITHPSLNTPKVISFQ